MRWALKHLLAVPPVRISPVGWANGGRIARWAASRSKPEHGPIVIMSLPRSGSSWVGRMLAQAQRVLYLREPINQTVLANTNLSTLFEVACAETEITIRPISDDVFAAYPAFDRSIVKHPKRWTWSRRRSGQLIVKEVNPFAYPWLQERYACKTIYLVRHPGAVASSYYRLGWTDRELDHLPTAKAVMRADHKANFWSYQGALQAIASKMMHDALDRQPDDNYCIVTYEALCADPMKAFRDLFTVADLDWSQDIERCIHQHATATNARRENTYGVQRDSAAMIDIWRGKRSTAECEALREAYLYYDPPLYAEAW